MDYELKYVIAICLIVKIAALSPEFSVSEETEKPEQISGAGEAPFLPPSPAKENPAASDRRQNREMVFNWGLGLEKFNRVKSAARQRKIKETERFDTCEQKLELLENSLKWRDIRKTLRWLDRLLAANKTLKKCHKRQNLKQRTNFHEEKSKNFDSHSTKHKKFLKNKNVINPEIIWEKNLALQKNSHSKKNKKFQKFRKNRSKKEKLKILRKESRFEKKYLQKSMFSPPMQNITILKPNSVLFDVEEMFFKRKSKNETRECLNGVENCQNKKNASQKLERESKKRTKTEKWSMKMRLREQDRGNNKTKFPEQKPWPHFVYHRVSSNFLHPGSTDQNRKKSAYIAISVVTANKPESTDNINNI